MKTAIRLMTFILVVGFNAMAQESGSTSELAKVVETERAFARAAEQRGIRDSFLAYIDEDGLLFRPGAVNGKKWMLEHPIAPSQKRPLLSWRPTYADVARAGDLAYTYGPWEFKEDITDQKPVGYGHFVTVWKKQPDGSWKFAVDLGIGHAAPKDPITTWQPPADHKKKSGKWAGKSDLNLARAGLLKRDREFSNASLTQGSIKAYLSYSAPDLKLFREDSHPFRGIAAASQALSTKLSANDHLTWQPVSSEVSHSEDLGYTHGTYSLGKKQQPEKVIERGSYVRIWKRQKGVWKVVLDVTNAWPPDKQSGT